MSLGKERRASLSAYFKCATGSPFCELSLILGLHCTIADEANDRVAESASCIEALRNEQWIVTCVRAEGFGDEGDL